MPQNSQILSLEFTVEPFVPDAPGPHVLAAQTAASDATSTPDIGPFGTTVSGSQKQIVSAVGSLVDEAFSNGAERIVLQISKS